MEVDEAMVKLGFMKKWQLLVCFMLLFMLQPPSILNINSILFFAYIPRHHCKIPANSSIEQWIPKDSDGNLASCSMYVNSSVSNKTVYCPNGWEYDEQAWGKSIINEWDLVCDEALYAGYSHMVFVCGQFFSSFLGGLSDIYGRRPISIIFLGLLSVGGIIVSFAGSYTVFVCGKFFLGVFDVISVNYTVYLSEITSSLNRDIVVSGAYFHRGTILSILVLLAYFISNWRYLKLTLNLYGLLVLPVLIIFLPETVYWLHANNRIKEAEEVLISAGKLNNVQFTKPILIQKENDESSKDKKYFEEITSSEKIKNFFAKLLARTFGSNNNVRAHYSTKELYRNPYLLKHMLFGIFLLLQLFLVMSMSFISTSISSYRFLSALFNVAIQIPAGFICFFLIKRYSIRNLMMVFMLLTSASIFICFFLQLIISKEATNYTNILFIVLAKFFISMVTAMVGTYPSTLFPTNLRNRACSICMLIGRVGPLLSSVSTYMLTVLPRGSYVIFATSAFLGALLLIIFPDTSGLSLPETIEDVENIYKKKDNYETAKLLEEKEVLADDVDE